ncbi:MAG: FAD-dependent oxidoreductase [Chromatiales bacterium]|nr:FAD-dependent oxidoreductase [Chromatiales bacterium]
MTSAPTLFTPISIGGVGLRNRLAHPAMVSRFVHDGAATAQLLNYYENRARGGAGLVVSEPLAMLSVPAHRRRIQVRSEGGLESLRRIAEAVERHDTRLLGQIQDPGRGRHEVGRNEHAVGASALPDDLSWTVPRVLSPGEIRRMIDEWAEGSARLKSIGFSGVEISAGHGHLFHQFLSPAANWRTDEYGGDLEGRTRFLWELIAAIRAACGRPFIIGLKLPGEDDVPGGIDLEQAGQIARRLAATGEVDYWTFAWGAHARSLYRHLPGVRGPRTPYFNPIRELRAADPGIVTGVLGFITDPNEAERALTDGTADIAFIGRAMITDAAWGEKVRTGREAEMRYCVSCNSCWKAIVEDGVLSCDNNPRVGEVDEADWQPEPAARSRRVVVVGAGIAGLEAAWVAAARGHEVTVFGRSEEPGGKTRLHAELPGGENLSSIYDYQYTVGRRHGVRFELGQAADAAAVLALEPEVVVMATGARPLVPGWVPEEYAEQGLVPDLRSFMLELRSRKTQEPGRVVLIDQDHTDMTYAAAERLAGLFEAVTIVTPRERIAADCALVNRQEIYQQLADLRVQIITSHELRDLDALEEGELVVHNIYNGDPLRLPDVVALTYATSRVPDDGITGPLRDAGLEVIAVGDCVAPRSVMAATREGHAAGLRI